MPVQGLSVREQHLYKVIDRINQIMQGRSNATGTVTLSSTGATTTSVTAKTCQVGSQVFLTPQTANAGTMNAFIKSTNVSSGQFIISQSSSTSTDLVFGWAVFG